MKTSPQTNYESVISNRGINAFVSTTNKNQIFLSDSTLNSPQLATFTQSSNLSGTLIDSNLTLTFNTPIKAISGDIVISNGSDIRTIAITDKSQVTINDNIVTVKPKDNLIANSDYSVAIAPGVLADKTGNAFTGINLENSVAFTTQDLTLPKLVSVISQGVDVIEDGSMVLIFDKPVQAGNGNIIFSNGTDVRKLSITDSQVSINGNQITINPNTALETGSDYNVQLDAGAIKDVVGNSFSTDGKGVNFMFENAYSSLINTQAPKLTSITPSMANLKLIFNTPIKAINGDIVISNGSDTRTISITDSSQITIQKNIILITPKDDLAQNTDYTVQLAKGVIADKVGNAFVGQITTFKNGTTTLVGKAIDGYLKDANVFADADGNGLWSAGEAKTTTNATGDFILTNPNGVLFASGGIDLSTGQAFKGLLKAPEGSTVITPLTTLQQGFIEAGLTVSQAQQAVATALGFDSSKIDLKTYDPIVELLKADTSGASVDKVLATKMLAINAQVANFLVTAGQVLQGAAGDNLSTQIAGNALVKSLVAAIQNDAKIGDGKIDLADLTLLNTVLIEGVKESAKNAIGEATNFEATITKMANTVSVILKDAADNISAVVSKGGTASNLLTSMSKVSAFTQDDIGIALSEMALTLNPVGGVSDSALKNQIDIFTGNVADTVVANKVVTPYSGVSSTNVEVTKIVNAMAAIVAADAAATIAATAAATAAAHAIAAKNAADVAKANADAISAKADADAAIVEAAAEAAIIATKAAADAASAKATAELAAVQAAEYAAAAKVIADAAATATAAAAAVDAANAAANAATAAANAAALAAAAAAAIDSVAPVLTSATVNNSILVLTYTEANTLDATNIAVPSNFAVTVNGVTNAVNNVAVNATNKTVTLTLATPVLNNQTVLLSYTDVAGNTVAAIQDATGNDAIGLTNQAVVNTTPDITSPVFASATVTGSSLVMSYVGNNALDATNIAATSNFAVTVNGVANAVTNVVVNGSAKTVTLTLATPVLNNQTVLLNYTDVVGNTVNAIQDVAGNDAVVLVSQAVTNATPDSTAPVLASATVNTSTLVLTYTEANTLDATNIAVPSNFAVTVNGVSNTVNNVAVNATNKTVTLTLATPVLNNQTVLLSYTDVAGNTVAAIQDVAGNDAAGLTNQAVINTTPDITSPLFASATVTGSSLVMSYVGNNALDATNIAATSNFSVTVNGVANAVTNVVVNGSAKTVTLTLTTPVLNNQTVLLNYTDVVGNTVNAIQDVTGNDAVALVSQAVTNATPDSTAPVLASATVNTSTLVLTYTEANTLDATNIAVPSNFAVTVNGVANAVNNVAVNATNKTVTLTLNTPVLNNQTVLLSYTDVAGNTVAAIQDAAGNDAIGLTNQAVINTTPDITSPLFASATVTGSSLVMSYVGNNALDATNIAATSNFSVTVNGVANAVTNVVVNGSAKTVTLTLTTPVLNNQTVLLNYTDVVGNTVNAIQDVTGNDAVALVSQAVTNATPDSTAPVLASATVNTSTLVLTYTEANTLDATNIAVPSNFAVTVNGVANAVNNVAVNASAKTVTLTLATPVLNNQTVLLSYTDVAGNTIAAIQDAAGNDAIGLTNQAVINTTPDITSPVFASATVTGSSLVMSYVGNNALDATNIAATSNFAVTVNGVANAVTNVVVNGSAKTVTLTLTTPVLNNQTVLLNYTDAVGNTVNAIQDVAGNDAVALVSQAVTNATPDSTAPVLASATVNTSTLVLTYTEANTLDATNIAVPSNFAVTVNGVANTVNNVAVNASAKTVTLTLNTPVLNNQTVLLSYTDVAGNTVAAIQDAAGNDAIGLTNQAVINTTPDITSPLFASATVTGSSLVMSYVGNNALDATNIATVSDFAVTVNGVANAVTNVVVNGAAKTVTLTLTTPVLNNQTVLLNYTDAVGNTVNAIQDVTGNDAVALVSQAVTNATPDSTAPVLASATVNTSTLVLTYTEANTLDATNIAVPSNFAVTVNGVANAVNNVAVNATNKTVTLTLATPVLNNQTVLLSYTDVAGNTVAATQDAAGNDAVGLTNQAVINTTPDITSPLFASATVTGSSLVMSYVGNNALDATNVAATSDFAVTVNGVANAVTNVVVNGAAKTVTLTLTTPVLNNQTVLLNYTDAVGNTVNAIQDVTGNDAVALVSQAVTNATPDSTAPVLASATVNTSTLVLTYTEANTLDATNIAMPSNFAVTVNGVANTVNNVAVNASNKTVTLTLNTPVLNNQTVLLSYTDVAGNTVAAIQDAAGNDAIGLTNQAVINTTPDITSPLFASATVTGSSLVMSYVGNNALNATNIAATSDFAVTVNGVANAVTNVIVNGSAKTVTLTLTTPVLNNQTVLLNYTDAVGNTVNAIQDVTGNDAVALVSQAVTNATPDSTAPVLASATVNTSTLVLTYTEANTLDATNIAVPSNFAVTVNGVSNTVNNVAVNASNKTVTLTLNTPVLNNQTVLLSYTDVAGNTVSAIQDAAGNDAVGLTNQAVINTTPDITSPVFASATVTGSSLVMSYVGNNALDATNIAATSNFAVTVNGVANAVTNVVVNGSAKTVTLTLTTPVLNNQTVLLNYTDAVGNTVNAIQDVAGNDAVALVSQAVTNATPDSTAPVLASATVNTSTLVLTYTEANTLDATNIAVPSNFAVTVNGVANAVNNVAVNASAKTVTLTLATPVLNNQTVLLSYTDIAGNTVAAIQDAAGNDAIGLTNQAVINTTPDITSPLFASATVTGSSLVMSYVGNNALDATNIAATSNFAVTVNGVANAVTNVVVNGSAKTVTLTLTTPVLNNQTVLLNYTDAVGNTVNAIQDVLGNDAVALVSQAVTNATPDSTAPVLASATVNTSTLILTYTEANTLDATNIAVPSNFAVTVNGVANTVNNVVVNASNKTVTLTLATPVLNNQTVLLSYTDVAGNTVAATQDVAGNDAVSLTNQAVINTTPDITSPVFASATVTGSSLVMSYVGNNALDATNIAAASDFAVTVNGVANAVTNVVVNGAAKTVTLTLTTPVLNNQTVLLNYTDAVGNTVNAIQDVSGNDAVALVSQAVTNATPDSTAPVLASATVNTSTLVLTYTEANTLDATNIAVPSNFSVTADGVANSVSNVAVNASAKTVTLTLATPVLNNQVVLLSYTDVAGNTIAAIQDNAGNDAVGLTNQAVVNTTPNTDQTFTLTTNADAFTGAAGNDTFNGTYDAGVSTDTFGFGGNDVLNGNGGIDTLHIDHLIDVAITPPDALWTNLSSIEKVVLNTTGNGAQTLTTGSNFNTAFSSGVDLNMATSGAGAINITMTSFTHPSTITGTTMAGAQTIQTGSGVSTVTATSGAGALNIAGTGLTTVVATSNGDGAQNIGGFIGTGSVPNGGASLTSVNAITAGVGAQVIISTSTSAVIVNATSGDGATTVITGSGNDAIYLFASSAAGANAITAGAGADTVNLYTNFSSADNLTQANGDSKAMTANTTTNLIAAGQTITFGNGLDIVNGFAGATDVLNVGTGGLAVSGIGMNETAFTATTTVFFSGNYDAGTHVFTIAENGIGASTLLLDTTTIDDQAIATADTWVLLIGTNSASLISSTFI